MAGVYSSIFVLIKFLYLFKCTIYVVRDDEKKRDQNHDIKQNKNNKHVVDYH